MNRRNFNCSSPTQPPGIGDGLRPGRHGRQGLGRGVVLLVRLQLPGRRTGDDGPRDAVGTRRGRVPEAGRPEMPESRVLKPVDMIMLGDAKTDGSWDGNMDPKQINQWPSSRHAGRTKLMLCDGHAERPSGRMWWIQPRSFGCSGGTSITKITLGSTRTLAPPRRNADDGVLPLRRPDPPAVRHR